MDKLAKMDKEDLASQMDKIGDLYFLPSYQVTGAH